MESRQQEEHTLAITVQRGGEGGWTVVVEYQRAGGFLPNRAEGVLHLAPVDLLPLQLDAAAYGTLLGQALFRDHVRDCYVAALAETAGADLHTFLTVDAPDLRGLRWERLCAPDGGGWLSLALNQNTPFSLYLPSPVDRSFPPIGRLDLRALVIVACPDNLNEYHLDSFDVGATVANVRAALGQIPCDVLASGLPDALGLPTADKIQECLTTGRYTLLHVVCHGQITTITAADGTPGATNTLFLVDDNNRARPVITQEIIETLKPLQRARGLPYLIFLSSCFSAGARAEDTFGGLAQQLVRELGIPAVVAMTDLVTVATIEQLVGPFYRELREDGLIDRALVVATAGQHRRQDVASIVPALFSRLGGRPLFSRALDRPLTNAEIRYGLARLQPLLDSHAPILAPVVAGYETTLKRSLDTNEEVLGRIARQERQQALADLNTLCLQAVDLTFSALAQDETPPHYDAQCPFRGLAPFRAEDYRFYFGREQLVGEIQSRLGEHPFLAVVGASGSGKSSVLQAGLIPALAAATPGVRVAYLTPGTDPSAQLVAHLNDPAGRPTVVIVDQCEELFTLCTDPNKRAAFVTQLLDLTDDVLVVLGMRDDFVGQIAPFRPLRDQLDQHSERIWPLDGAELRQVIEAQARAANLHFETNLSQRLLIEVQREPGAMPLLQHTLLELWNRRHGRWLTTAEYEAIGGVQQGIAYTAEAVFASATVAEQELLRDIFLRLTRLDRDEGASATERRDTRRRATASDLIPAGNDGVAINALVRRLADARLLVTSTNIVTKGDDVTLAHEALIQYWPRLQAWLAEDRSTLLLREQIHDDALAWQEGQRDASLLLYRDKQLRLAQGLTHATRSPLNALEREYIDACAALEEARHTAEVAAARSLAAAEALARGEAEQRIEVQQQGLQLARRSSQKQRVALAVLVVLVLGLGLVSLWAYRQRRVAQSRAWALQAITLLPTDPELSLLLAHEAARQWHTAEAEDALRLAFNQAPTGTALRGHAEALTDAAYSPDGTLIATASRDRTVRLWRAQTRQLLLTLTGHTGDVTSVGFSADSTTVVTASGDGTARLWDARTGAERRTLQPTGEREALWTAAFAPRSGEVAAGDNVGMVTVWEGATGRQLRQWRAHDDQVTSLAYSPDGQWLATASRNHQIIIWEVATGTKVTQALTGSSLAWRVAFSPSGHYVATASGDRHARIWETGTWKQMADFSGHSEQVTDAAFSPDERMLVTASQDQTARIWDIATRQSAQVLQGHTGRVLSAEFSPDGLTVLTASGDHVARLWPVRSTEMLTGHSGGVNAAVFSPDGQTIATGGNDATVRLWDATSGQQKFPPGKHTDSVSTVAFRPDGKEVASGGDDNVVRLWDAASGKETYHWSADRSFLFLTYSADGQFLVAGNENSKTYIYNVATKELVLTLEGHTSFVYGATFSPDGRTIATESDDATIRTWDARTGQPLRTWPAHDNIVWSVAYSPDGKRLVTAGQDKTARVWDAATGQLLMTLIGHTNAVTNAVYRPDGRYLLTSSRDQTVRVWDAATGRPVALFRDHTGAVPTAFYSNNSNYIVTASADGTARVYLCDLCLAYDDLLKRVPDRITRDLTTDERRAYLR